MEDSVHITPAYEFYSVLANFRQPWLARHAAMGGRRLPWQAKASVGQLWPPTLAKKCIRSRHI